jgi:hypothetical protein
MPKITIPKETNYVEVYFSLKCNLHCAYCVNAFGVLRRSRHELSAARLAEGLNRIDFGLVPVTLGGGEPTIRKDFYELLDMLSPEIGVDLLTNCQFDVDEFIRRVSPKRFSSHVNPAYKSIRVSYHPSQMGVRDVIAKVQVLQEAGFNVGIFGISHPLNMIANIEMSELAREARVYFFIKDFLGIHEGHMFGFYKYPDAVRGEQKNVVCKTTELLIGPDGNIHRCHRDLYCAENSVSSIFDADLKIHFEYLPCSKFGECNVCDVKWKVNRFLSKGSCSVDIRL